MDENQLYKPPVGVAVGNWSLIAIWLFMLYQTVVNPEIFTEDIVLWYSALVLFSVFGFLNLWRFPTIAVLRDEMRVYSPWGTFRSIKWSEIQEIRLPNKPAWGLLRYPENYAVIKSSDLGFIYAMLGFLYDRGGELFFIFRFQPGYENLLDDFKDFAPFALAKELRKEERT